MVKNSIGISGVISEIICLSKSHDHTCADESSVIEGLCARYNVTKSEAQISIGLAKECGMIGRHRDGKLRILDKSKMNKAGYDERQGTCPRNLYGLCNGFAKIEHDSPTNNTILCNALKEIMNEVMCMPNSSNTHRIVEIINKVLREVDENLVNKDKNVQPQSSHVVNSNDERTYKRGETDGKFGHPPAEATESYLHGYSDGLRHRY